MSLFGLLLHLPFTGIVDYSGKEIVAVVHLCPKSFLSETERTAPTERHEIKLAANHTDNATGIPAMRTKFALRSAFARSYQMVLLVAKPICTRNMAKVKPGAFLA